METDYKRIFYVEIAWEKHPESGQNLKKTGLHLKKLGREYPYLLGRGRRKINKLQIYFVLLPEYAGKRLFSGKMKNWKPECAQKLLNEAWERAYVSHGCTEQIFALPYKSYAENCQESIFVNLLSTGPSPVLPVELWAVGLYQSRPFDSLCIMLPEDAGEQEAEQLKELMEPYLPRMKRVIFKGPKSTASELLNDYLYEEFGIVMTETQRVLSGMPVLDFCTQEYGSGKGYSALGDTRKDKVYNLQEGRKWPAYISEGEILKFLDIAVKNGYNTKVN